MMSFTIYDQSSTSWFIAEGTRDPERLPLLAEDLFTLLERMALLLDCWTEDNNIPLTLRLGSILNDVGKLELRGADGTAVATALVNANIVCETGFAHKSIEEYLLARALSKLMRTGEVVSLSSKRITDDVISFFAEDEVFRGWLDQHQDQLAGINADYLPHLIRLLHRQGRAIPKLDLRGAKLDNLQLPGIRFRGADLRKANLTGTQLGPADLTDADLRGTILRQASVWTSQRVSELYASADGPDRIWLIHPTANIPNGLAVQVQISRDGGRIAACQQYNQRSSKLVSDGQSLYRLPKIKQRQKAEITQWLGEDLAVERWWLSSESIPLASNSLPGAVWQISTNCAILYNDDVELKLFPHQNGPVRGVLGVSKTSTFARHQLDGFYLIGSKLWAIGPHLHMLISEGLTFIEPLQRIAAVGETCIVFKVGTDWQTWAPNNKESVGHPQLAEVNRITQIPTGGFALIRSATVEFVDADFSFRSSQLATIGADAYLAGIKRENNRAIVVKDYQGLSLIDEKSGPETLNWLTLRAARARFDEHTELNIEFRSALTAADARDESLTTEAPSLKNIMTITLPSPQSHFDVLLITVNEHEFDAVYALAQEKLGKEPTLVPKKKRVYYDLGIIGGSRVGMVRSQMGSTQPGATTTTTLQAMREVCPRYLIVVGIAFGVDPDKQPIGQILYSEKLQDYNLFKIGTDKDTKEPIIIPRGDKVSPNPMFLNRVQSAADTWRRRESDIPVSPALLLSGDTLVDNVDYRALLLKMFPDALGGEMEATGVYTASREDETPWVIIKAVCDYADGNKRDNKEERQKQAAKNAARFVFHFIERSDLTPDKMA
jgi:nucleoside phosphorylase